MVSPCLEDDRHLLKWSLQHHLQLVQERLCEPLLCWIPIPSWPLVPSGYPEYTWFIVIECLKMTCKTSPDCKKSLTYVTISASAAVVSIEYSQVHYLCSVRSVLQQKLPGSLGKPVSPPKMLINTSKHICCAYSYNSGVCRCEVTVFKSFIPWVRIMYQREHVIQSFHGVLDLRGYKGNVGK